MYSAQVLDHFEHPRNAGEIADADAGAQLENRACGDVLKLTLRVSGGRIDAVRFQAKGCVATVACASALTELAEGLSLEEARGLKRERLVEAVGGLPAGSAHASHLALETLAAALNQLAD